MSISQRELLEAQVARFSRAPSGTPARDCHPHRVLVVPFGASLEAGFRVARRVLADGKPLRIVGTCVTEPSTWPEWVHGAPNVILSELGAYRFAHGIPGTAALMTALHSWLDDVLGPALDGLRPARALSHAAAMRFFQLVVDGHLFFEGIRLLHGQQKIIVCGSRGGGEELIPPSAAKRAAHAAVWPLAIGATMGAAFVAATGMLARDHVRSRRSRSKLAELASNAKPREKPSMWVALVPDLVRANQHVLESVVEPALARGESLSVLLIGSLGSGTRTEAQLRSENSATLWPGLGVLNKLLGEIEIAQCVGPRGAAELARDLAGFAGATARTLGRIATRGAIDCEGVSYSLLPFVWDVARLVTLDVGRARRAYHAAQRFLATHEMRNTPVVTVASAGCEISPVDAALQDAGATTIELFHGTAGAYWHGFAESAASVRGVWSHVDRELHVGARHAVVVGGMPIRVRRTRAPQRPPRNVLVMTNLVHRDHDIIDFPWRPFQKGLVAALDDLSRDAALDLRVRWRPHPGDAEALVREDLKRAPKVELSIGQPLQDDLDWADIAVSNPSTVLVEALLTDIPVIAYLIPDLMIGCEYVHPSRVVFNGSELRKAIEECVRRFGAGDPEALAPERHALTNLFGPSRVPGPLDLREAHAAGRSNSCVDARKSRKVNGQSVGWVSRRPA